MEARGTWGEKTAPRNTESLPRAVILTFALHGSVACVLEKKSDICDLVHMRPLTSSASCFNRLSVGLRPANRAGRAEQGNADRRNIHMFFFGC